MTEQQFPPNNASAAARLQQGPPQAGAQKPEKDVKPIVTEGVIIRKTPLGKRIKNLIFGGEGRGNVLANLWQGVMVLEDLTMAVDAINQGVQRLTHPGSAMPMSGYGRRPGYSPARVAYGAFSSIQPQVMGQVVPQQMGQQQQPKLSPQARRNHDFGEIILATRVQAQEVLGRMVHLIDNYQIVTLADFYNLIGEDPDFMADQWGWYDLRSAQIRRVPQGYLIDLPPCVPVD